MQLFVGKWQLSASSTILTSVRRLGQPFHARSQAFRNPRQTSCLAETVLRCDARHAECAHVVQYYKLRPLAGAIQLPVLGVESRTAAVTSYCVKTPAQCVQHIGFKRQRYRSNGVAP